LGIVSVAVETLLVTGATGFVGSHVLESDAIAGFRVRALVRKAEDARRLESQGVATVQGSLEDAPALQQAMSGMDTVLHLAAATKARSPEAYRVANALGTEAVIEAMLATQPRPKRLIYLSSLAAVGPAKDGRPVTRADTPRPLTAYGRTKLAGEIICEAVASDFDVAILRAPAVYGPRDRDVFEVFRLARYGVSVLPTGPERRLQMIHAADLARALLLAAGAHGATGVYHVAEARSYDMDEMTRMVAAAVGRKPRIIHLPGPVIAAAATVTETGAGLLGKSVIFNRDKAREILAPGWLCETELARRDFGFEAQIPLQAGLNETAAWYKKNGWL
jgi:nucleoside-diphosphate-sugar epimerase